MASCRVAGRGRSPWAVPRVDTVSVRHDATSTDSPFCETDWITDDLQIGAFVYGDSRSTTLTTEWLIAILPDVLESLSGDAFGRITAGEPY